MVYAAIGASPVLRLWRTGPHHKRPRSSIPGFFVMYWVYILYSKEHGKTYVGQSKDVERRLQEHNVTGTSGYTKRYRPWVLIHVEQYASRSEAIKRERFLKTGVGRVFVREMVEKYLNKG